MNITKHSVARVSEPRYNLRRIAYDTSAVEWDDLHVLQRSEDKVYLPIPAPHSAARDPHQRIAELVAATNLMVRAANSYLRRIIHEGGFADGRTEPHIRYYSVDDTNPHNDFVADFKINLDRLVQAEVIGGIQRVSPLVCKLFYFRCRTEMVRRETATEVRMTEERIHTTFYEELMNVHEEPAVQYQTLPPMAARLVHLAPAWLKPHLTVVGGDRVVEEKLVGRSIVSDWVSVKPPPPPPLEFTQETGHRDPVLCLGNYVLYGWHPSEEA